MALLIEAEPTPLATDEQGAVRIGGTRVTLDTVVGAFLDGATAEEIAQGYPVLGLAEVYAVVAWYLRHRAEADEYLRQRAEEAEAVRTEVAARCDPAGIRERLLARRNQGQT